MTIISLKSTLQSIPENASEAVIDHHFSTQLLEALGFQTQEIHPQYPTGDGTVVSSGDDEVKLWDVQTGKNIFTFIGGIREEFQTTAISPSGKMLLAGGFDQIISAWDLEKKSLILSLFKYKLHYSHDGFIFSLVFSSDRKWVASGGSDKKIKLWKALTGKLNCTLNGHSDTVSALAFTPDSQLLVSGSADKTIRIWAVNSDSPNSSFEILQGHTGKVTCLAVAPDGEYLISGSLDQTIKIWQLKTKELVNTFRAHSQRVFSLAINPQGDIFATAGLTEIKIWNITTGELLEVLSGCYPIVFSRNGDLLVSASEDNNIIIWSRNLQTIFSPKIDFSQEWWEILGVEVDSSLTDVKTAYRVLAKRFHPDSNKEPEAILTMQVINYAYEKFLNEFS